MSLRASAFGPPYYLNSMNAKSDKPAPERQRPLRLVEFNVRHGGGKQGAAIAAALARHNPDVIVLTEYRESNGGAILDPVREVGLTHSATSGVTGKTNGVCVLSKEPFEVVRSPFAGTPLSSFWLEVCFPSRHLSAICIYGPQAGTLKSNGLWKDKFWKKLINVARERIDDRLLIVGDLNTGAASLDCPPGSRFFNSEDFEQLTAMGWVDAWLTCNAEKREFTWFSRRRTGPAGWRLDHAFLSPPLARSLVSCRYSHDERESGLSDHSALVLTLSHS
jgi:exodeoxyribonuclease-3